VQNAGSSLPFKSFTILCGTKQNGGRFARQRTLIFRNFAKKCTSLFSIVLLALLLIV